MLDKIANFFLVHAAIVLPLAVVFALLVSSTARGGFLTLLRFVARPILIAAVIALVYDGTRTLAGGSGFVVTSLGTHWTRLAPQSLEATKNLLSAKVHPSAWDVVVQPVLHLPGWLVLATLGLLLAWLGRRRKQVPIFIN